MVEPINLDSCTRFDMSAYGNFVNLKICQHNLFKMSIGIECACEGFRLYCVLKTQRSSVIPAKIG